MDATVRAKIDGALPAQGGSISAAKVINESQVSDHSHSSGCHRG